MISKVWQAGRLGTRREYDPFIQQNQVECSGDHQRENCLMALKILLAAVICFVAASTSGAVSAELIMLREDGCGYCEQWEEEIGVVYGKTSEGRRLPLRRIDLHDRLPADLKFLVKGGYTPTFVVVDKGREIGRIRGYPGEDFFWGLLGQLIKRLPSEKAGPSRVN